MFLPKPEGSRHFSAFLHPGPEVALFAAFSSMIVQPRMRLSPDLRTTTLFVLAVIALAVAAAVTVRSGRAYVDAVHHIESLALPDVHGDVSSTSVDAQRDAGLAAPRSRERIATVYAEREAARLKLES